jgi:hypothetical protein
MTIDKRGPWIWISKSRVFEPVVKIIARVSVASVKLILALWREQPSWSLAAAVEQLLINIRNVYHKYRGMEMSLYCTRDISRLVFVLPARRASAEQVASAGCYHSRRDLCYHDTQKPVSL